ncbi:MAG TPA: FeoA family protein [Candidatus Acidoferrales bacterium]|nr:FeoA family protein [Candidatus Acidoferrales bacterium]
MGIEFNEIVNEEANAIKILETGILQVNLKELKTGEAAQIVGFSKHDDAIKKIEAMGLRKGKRITVLKKLGRGILVKAGGTRIVITADVAKNIEVE